MIRVAWWLCVGLAVCTGAQTLWPSFLPEPPDLIYNCLVYALILAPVALYAHRHYGQPWPVLFPLRGMSWRFVAPLLVASLGMLIITGQTLALCRALSVLSPDAVDALAGDPLADEQPPPASLLLGLVSISVLPAVAEEALARGLLLQALLPSMSARRAVAYSAFLFAALHLRLERLPDTLLLGIFYGWLFIRTGSLLPSMLAHATHNAMVVFAQFAEVTPEGLPGWLATNSYGFMSLPLTLAGVAAFCAGLLWARCEFRLARARAEALGQETREPLGFAA